MDEIVFQNCLVAHIDVMGFKNLLANQEDAKKKLKAYFDDAKEFLTGKASIYSTSAPDDNFKALFVSDSIILSVELRENQEDRYLVAGRFFNTIANLQYIMALRHQIWTRGAVSVGPLVMNVSENILVGQGFVDAFYLEKTADYPRVILDPKILCFFKVTLSEFAESIKLSFDGVRILGVHHGARYGAGTFNNDAPMIDWFRLIFFRYEQYDAFFDDLEDRMAISQDLFRKVNRLVPYLLESYYRVVNDEEGQGILRGAFELEDVKRRILRFL